MIVDTIASLTRSLINEIIYFAKFSYSRCYLRNSYSRVVCETLLVYLSKDPSDRTDEAGYSFARFLASDQPDNDHFAFAFASWNSHRFFASGLVYHRKSYGTRRFSEIFLRSFSSCCIDIWTSCDSALFTLSNRESADFPVILKSNPWTKENIYTYYEKYVLYRQTNEILRVIYTRIWTAIESEWYDFVSLFRSNITYLRE